MDENKLLRTYPGDLTDEQAEYVRTRINNDDGFRKNYLASTDYGSPSLSQMPVTKPKYSYQADVERVASGLNKKPEEIHAQRSQDFDDIMSGEFDYEIMDEIEKMDMTEVEQIVNRSHPNIKSIEDKGGIARLQKILVTTPNRRMSAKLSEVQRMLYNARPDFAKAYDASDENLIKVQRPMYKPRQGAT